MRWAEGGFTAAQTAGIRAAVQPGPVQVIAVTGGKGGTGKTCVAVNLAAALAAQHKRVLLLDGDLGLANADVQLGLTPRYTLEHVLDGRCTLEEAVMDTPAGFRLIPAASGVTRLTSLSTAEHLGLVQAFSHLSMGLDVLVVDTAAGIADSVRQFCQAAQHVLVVVNDEPASLTDAYALIKVLHRSHGVGRFHVLANRSAVPGGGEQLFRKLERVTGRFLDVVLEYAGEIPEDNFVKSAIRGQRCVVGAYPSSAAARAFARLAARTARWAPTAPRGNLEFFIERLLPRTPVRLELAR
ncbi:MAG: AAA family ATPase [Pseudomonadota bacterium]|jgi:flagellar biosynthesis protein FlhG|nr:MAG: cobyrinic acid a,c-diamide synthase [Pseudomonadota bacterium]